MNAGDFDTFIELIVASREVDTHQAQRDLWHSLFPD